MKGALQKTSEMFLSLSPQFHLLRHIRPAFFLFSFTVVHYVEGSLDAIIYISNDVL